MFHQNVHQVFVLLMSVLTSSCLLKPRHRDLVESIKSAYDYDPKYSKPSLNSHPHYADGLLYCSVIWVDCISPLELG